MRFGLFGGAAAPRLPDAAASADGFFDFIETNVEAEALGFHSSFVTEHHFTKIGQLSAPLTLLTYLAARTTRLRLGTAILVLPWHNPVLLAEQVATLDLLSRGRLDLGIGKGYRHNEFAGFALPPADAETRFEEVLDVMVRALGSDAPFSHRGQFFRFDEVVVEPPPYQRPHPPLWLAAGSAASITACARRGFNLLLDQFASPLQIKERITLYRHELEAAGHAFDPMRVAVARNIFVAEDASEAAEARKRQERVHERLLSLSRGSQSRPGSHILGYTETLERDALAMIGPAKEIADKLAALAEVGVAYVLLSGQGSRPNLRRFAEKVMPKFGAP
ncbi:Flavin-dependent oxidoreductase, luciferase family (includes alkanesulfonate monooxygenase SsuD and methylene tetrahydromethanopterin reductase) [Rhodospirillales bacterium URHD0017]|nr:Flavin-dependent oxidoreductase, luciferase family (includes alkanesulfonate monooxygenase SsuD and methylene tetrahydromethanopterin reductase) [Rhodospirillales bacterium URHD0017]